MKHRAPHPLPVTTGWSGGERPTVWCGRCRASYEIDDEWVDRYLKMKRKRLLAQVGRYGLTLEGAAEIYADYERRLRITSVKP